MKDEFKGQRYEPFLMIFHTEARSKAFLSWTKTLEYTIWMYVNSWTVRALGAGGLFGDTLYKEYFTEKKLLTASVGIDQIAEVCGTSKSRVSKCLKEMEEKGFLGIKKIKKNGKGRDHNIYILGTHNGFKQELTYVMKHFMQISAAERLGK